MWYNKKCIWSLSSAFDKVPKTCRILSDGNIFVIHKESLWSTTELMQMT